MSKDNVTKKLSIYVNDKEVVNSMSGISKAIVTTRAQINNLNRDSEDYDTKMAGLKETLANLITEHAAYRKELDGTTTELKAAENSLEGVENRMKDVEKELRLLDAAQEDYNERVAALRQEYAELDEKQQQYAKNISTQVAEEGVSANSLAGVTARMKEVKDEMGLLDATSEGYQERLATMREEYAGLQEQQAQYRQDIEGLNQVQTANLNTLEGVAQRINEIKTELWQLDNTSENYREEIARLQEEEAGLIEQQTAMNAELGNTQEESDSAGEALANLFTGLTTGNLTMAASGLAGVRAAIVATTKSALAFIATPIGATIAVLAGIALATKEWYDYNKEVAKADKLTQSITKLTGDAADEARVRATAMAKTFDQDFEELLSTASTLVNEFDISYNQAFDSIEKGFVKGGDASDEFLESMREYPTFFAQAGFSVEEFQNLINTGADLSIYQDKLPDAIKEFSLAITEQTAAAKDAIYNAFGTDFTDRLLKGVKDGTISVKDALAQISAEANRIGLNAQQAQLLTADLFKGAGEDAGGAMKIFKAYNQSIESQFKPLTEAQQATEALAKSERDMLAAKDAVLKSEGFGVWASKADAALNVVSQRFYEMLAYMTGARKELENAYKIQANKEFDAKVEKDEIERFKDRMARNKKIVESIGQTFDFEKEKSEYLARLQQNIDNTKSETARENLQVRFNAVESYLAKTSEVTNKNSLDDINAQKKAGDDKLKAYKKETDEITALLWAASQERMLDGIEGIDLEIKKIEQKWDEQKKKYAGHLDKMQALEEAKQAEIQAARDKADDAEIKAGIALYSNEEKEITDLLKKSQQERDNNRLNAAQKEDAEITQRWEAELEKYKDHAERKAELEAERDAELAAAKELRAKESAERIRQMELEMEQERNGRIFSNAMYLQEFEAENEMNRAVAKAEREGASQEEIAAIKKKYAEREQQTGIRALDFFTNLKNSEVKWSELTEKQKLALVKEGLSLAAEMFGKGTGAWKTLKIAEAYINTKQAAIAAYQAMAGIPIVGPALGVAAAGVVTAYGIKQVAEIAKTKVPQGAKFFKGGYTGSAIKYGDEFGGVAQISEFHPNEYVIPAKMMDMPQVANTAAWLENIRTGKTAAAPVAANTGSANAALAPLATGADPELKAMLVALVQRLDNPVAPVINYGYEDLERHNKMQKELTASTNNGKLST